MSAPVARCAGFELDPRKFLQDTAHMTAEQVGVYARLLFRGWRDLDHPGWYPDDDRALRQMAGATEEEWDRSRDAIRACMKPRVGGLLQKGQAEEHARQTRSVAGSKAHARAAAKSRWDKEKTCTSIAGAMPEQCSSNASVLPSSLPLESKEESTAGVSPPAKPPRRRRVPDRTIPPGYTHQLAARFGLTIATVEGLLERILLEFDARGYVSARAVLLRWCEREVSNRASPPKGGNRFAPTAKPEPTPHPLLADLERYERENPA